MRVFGHEMKTSHGFLVLNGTIRLHTFTKGAKGRVQ